MSVNGSFLKKGNKEKRRKKKTFGNSNLSMVNLKIKGKGKTEKEHDTSRFLLLQRLKNEEPGHTNICNLASVSPKECFDIKTFVYHKPHNK